jgi:hypothetical protein
MLRRVSPPLLTPRALYSPSVTGSFSCARAGGMGIPRFSCSLLCSSLSTRVAMLRRNVLMKVRTRAMVGPRPTVVPNMSASLCTLPIDDWNGPATCVRAEWVGWGGGGGGGGKGSKVSEGANAKSHGSRPVEAPLCCQVHKARTHRPAARAHDAPRGRPARVLVCFHPAALPAGGVVAGTGARTRRRRAAAAVAVGAGGRRGARPVVGRPHPAGRRDGEDGEGGPEVEVRQGGRT